MENIYVLGRVAYVAFTMDAGSDPFKVIETCYGYFTEREKAQQLADQLNATRTDAEPLQVFHIARRSD